VVTRGVWKNVVAAWRFVVDVALRWYHGGVGDLAAGVTFWILVSLPAAVLALLAALGWLDSVLAVGFQSNIREDVTGFVDRVFTAEGSTVGETVQALFEQDPNSGLLTVSLVVALWSISRGFAGLIRALEDIYEVADGRPWYTTRVVAAVLGVGSLLISVPLVLLERIVWENVTDGPVERLGRSLVAVVVLVLWASAIYHFGPAQRSRWRHDLPGAVTAAVMWWLLSIGFGWYVDLTSGANEVTAAVGAGLLALTWLWLSAQVLLIGGVVNFLYGRRRKIDRRRRRWNLNSRITAELRRIVVNGRDDHGTPSASEAPSTPEVRNGNGSGTARPLPTAGAPVADMPVEPR
jgi:membrane protein